MRFEELEILVDEVIEDDRFGVRSTDLIGDVDDVTAPIGGGDSGAVANRLQGAQVFLEAPVGIEQSDGLAASQSESCPDDEIVEHVLESVGLVEGQIKELGGVRNEDGLGIDHGLQRTDHRVPLGGHGAEVDEGIDGLPGSPDDNGR